MTIDDNKIAVAMARKRFTKTSLAEAAGISRNRLNVILNSKNVTPVAVGKIAKALDVDVTEIIEK